MSFNDRAGCGPRVKICGVADPNSLKALIKLRIDAVGFIFFDGSPRAVVGSQVQSWVEDMPPFVSTVGVFVDEKITQVKKMVDLCGLGRVQLHGQEPPEYCAKLPRSRVIKAFRVKEGFTSDMVKPYVPYVSAVMIDSVSAGETFDWSVARRIRDENPDLPVIVAGGISMDNVEEIVEQVDPYAIDVSSGVESSPGVKDPAKVEELLRRIRPSVSNRP